MSVETSWGHFFKPEVKNSGAKELAAEKIVLSIAGDTQIQAYARGTSSFKITLSSPSIESSTFTAECGCPAFAKGTFCKHIWATLLATQKRHPDFLSSKTNIELADASERVESPHKAKQAAYRKEQYQKQKTRAKEIRLQKKGQLSPKTAPAYPPDVQEALSFFASNGFPLEDSLNEDELKTAKKKLAKVFHPDLGGSHDETVLLNRNFDILFDFILS